MEKAIKIGNICLKYGLMLAPMAGFSDRAMRLVSKKYGAEYTTTEMVSAKAVVFGDKKTAKLLYINEDESPTAVQIFGSDPDIMAESARIISSGAFGGQRPAAIDINMGCPVPKIFKNGEGGYRASTISVPVLFPVEVDGVQADVDCAVCGLNVRRRKDGQIEAECILKLSIRAYENRDWTYVQEVETGDTFEENEYGFSVFMTQAGEELWQVAKRIRCAPEELKKSNPDLTFPLRGGERLYVYRRIK